MKAKGIQIPQAAIEAGNAAMGAVFLLDDVRGAVGGVMRELHYQSLQEDFDYGPNDKDAFDNLVATKLVQEQKNRGHIRYTERGWVRQGCPQPRARTA